jgi:hypothetical protein
MNEEKLTINILGYIEIETKKSVTNIGGESYILL